MKKALKDKIRNVKLLILDVDGVLTNGEIVLDHLGQELKFFNVQDGFALVVFKSLGYKTAIISARGAPAVAARAKDLKIDKVYQDAYPKIKAYKELLKELNLKEKETCFVGDDLPDVPVLERSGFAVAVANACAEAKKCADYVTKKEGGRGAVREVIELILKTNGQWKTVLRTFSEKL